MGLEEVRRAWDALGAADPFWAVLSDPAKAGGRWDIEEFMATGEREVAELMAHLQRLDLEVHHGRALDFGCGPGRLTQALGKHFEAVDGVDISAEMLELARGLNRHGERCHYHLNTGNRLEAFDDCTFDLAFSILTLQHIPPKYSQGYIAELVRVLAPGGVLIFQLPTPSGLSKRLRDTVRRLTVPTVHGAGPSERLHDIARALAPSPVVAAYVRVRGLSGMYGVDKPTVVKLLEEGGARLVEVAVENAAGVGMQSLRYWSVKR